MHAYDDDDDAALFAAALDTLAKLRHPLTSLAVLNLSSPLPPPSATTLAYLTSCGLVELQLQDVSIQRAASDGATNLLRSFPQSLERQPMVGSLADSIRTRGAAMVQFARSLPSLRRLSLCNAAFSTSDVAALSALTGLEELSLVGAMECSATLAPACPEADQSQASAQRTKQLEAAVAASVYKQLLAALPRLRSLHLPMAIAAPSDVYGKSTATNGWDSDEDAHDEMDQGRMTTTATSWAMMLDGGTGCWLSLSALRTVCPSSIAVKASQNEYRNESLSDAGSAAYTDVPSSSNSSSGGADGGFFASPGFEPLPLPTPGPFHIISDPPERQGLEWSPSVVNFALRPTAGSSQCLTTLVDKNDAGGASGGDRDLDYRDYPRGRGVCGVLSGAVLRVLQPDTAAQPEPREPVPTSPYRSPHPGLANTMTASTAAVVATAGPNAAPDGLSDSEMSMKSCWSFPPHLEELTIPLCSLNGPVFRAACEVYGGMDDTYGDDSGAARLPHRRLRALHITCAPGYSKWEGSFLNAEGDFAALARLAPSLESLHLCLELGASGRNALRRDRLRGCLRHLRALNKMKSP
ncbi:hypothetical protein VOLCADRAFT_98448 [Volvox carteri f. nagariensis]|uniref:Uncharacterized protein n=1 Tax=Volvox carteri f. nagariensis TaxID=3068 RepID=D8UFD1_VOLCA|nr:uncharacterized protein VOLCADRAFT_98448 [Volvox carteri f. nagariensis]EFJ41587.1 hypothetical protein VOLCADRAFT_98448 [Volvox carteri f. nagariensis]|eukprot:XP_002957378.1 hypothetical protein VOLCADRAFT_98448 [Volvox carteri f. nagariensis]